MIKWAKVAEISDRPAVQEERRGQIAEREERHGPREAIRRSVLVPE